MAQVLSLAPDMAAIAFGLLAGAVGLVVACRWVLR